MMLSSLRLRLILMFMLVVIIGTGTVALFASHATSSDLQLYTKAKNNQQIVSTLLDAYNHHQNQRALQALTERLARSSHQRIILYDHQMRVITDSDRKLIGQVLALPTAPQAGIALASAPPSTLSISTDMSNMSPLGQGMPVQAFSANSPEANFLTSVNQSLWLAAFIAGLTALLLALLFSSTILKPIRSLKVAASHPHNFLDSSSRQSAMLQDISLRKER